jgi:suppressor of G2 allele of SKP1
LPEDEATVKNDSEATVKEKEPVEKTTAPESSAPAPPPLPTRVRYALFQKSPDNRHEWYQTDQHIFVDMFFKNIPKDKCTVDLEPHSVLPLFVSPN